MRGRPRPQHEGPSSEIQLERVGDERCRRYYAYLVDQLVAHGPTKCIEIELSARGECAWQVRVADKNRSVLHESGVTEDMIGMAVRVDDIADRLAGAGANG